MDNAKYTFIPTLLKIAEAGLANQKVREGDYQDENGFLICGKCGEPRQRMQVPRTGNIEPFKVVCPCRCERELAAQQEQAEQERKRKERIRKLKDNSLMSPSMFNVDFQNLKTTPSSTRVIAACQKYADNFPQMLEKAQGLLLYGGVGTGKSTAATAIANTILNSGRSVVMLSVAQLLDLISRELSDNDAADSLERLTAVKLLIIDDLGAERNTDFALERIYNIINTRYVNNLPMIFTTNLSVEEMKKETDIRHKRIYDRIFEVCYPLKFCGTSWRQTTAAKKFEEMKAFFEEDE